MGTILVYNLNRVVHRMILTMIRYRCNQPVLTKMIIIIMTYLYCYYYKYNYLYFINQPFFYFLSKLNNIIY